MVKKYFTFTLLTLTFLIAGCSFYPRGSGLQALALQLPEVMLQPYQPYEMNQRLLRTALLQAGVQVKNEGTYPILKITRNELSTRPLIYGPNAEVRQQRLKLEIDYVLLNAKKEDWIALHTLTVEREQILDPNYTLGDAQEKAFLEQEMRMEIFQNLVYQLTILLKN